MNMHALEPLRYETGAPEPVTWVEAAGTQLAVMRRGGGVPLICLHAIGHGARDFEDLARRVGNRFEIIAPDWPGQGRSPFDDIPPTAAHYEKIALALLDVLKIERAILLGNSIGGATALRVAAHAPARVSALVLCDTGGLFPITPYARFVILRAAAFFGAGERGAKWFARAFRFYYRRIVMPRRPARAQCERIIASGYEIASVLRAAWEGFALEEADQRGLIGDLQCPVFFAWAKSDRVIPWSFAKATANQFKDKHIELFRGGHAAFLEDPERFADALLRFARERNLA